MYQEGWSIAHKLKNLIDKYIKIKDSCTIVSQLINDTLVKYLLFLNHQGTAFEIHKELWETSQNSNQKEGQRVWRGQVWKEKPKMTSRDMKKWLIFLINREIHITATMKFCSTTIKWIKCRMLCNTKSRNFYTLLVRVKIGVLILEMAWQNLVKLNMWYSTVTYSSNIMPAYIPPGKLYHSHNQYLERCLLQNYSYPVVGVNLHIHH